MRAKPPLRRIVITCCSGAGTSTQLAGLARRGHPVVLEPGRRILRHPALQDALLWVDPARFAERRHDLAAAIADMTR